MYGKIQQHLAKELEDIKNAGLFKKNELSPLHKELKSL